ncbi:MAG: metallophosphoesterase [Corynebacterium sp.]|nr:metallophosphoesterase [Corynebacterium sp.]
MSAAPDPNRIAFIGDLHGKPNAFEQTLDLAVSVGAATIIQTGDFGFHRPADLELLQLSLDERAPDVDYRIIDGNHEDFTLLTPDATAPTALTRSITYMPRGLRTTVAGINMLFLGGATSTDRQWRTEGVNWFPTEHITDAQVTRAITAASTGTGPADILVTHETGSAAFTALAHNSPHAQTKESDPLSQADRTRIDRVLTAVHPRVHVHGHHHARFAAPLDGELTDTLDVSLAKETDDGSVVVLDTHGGDPDQWTWSVPVSRTVFTYNDDQTEVLDTQFTIDTLPLRAWAQVELPWPEPALPDSTPRQTVESITANYMALQRQLGHRYPEGHQPDSQRPHPNPIRTRRLTLMVRQILSDHP